MSPSAFAGLVVVGAVATLIALWVLPPFGSFAVNAKVVN